MLLMETENIGGEVVLRGRVVLDILLSDDCRTTR